MPISKSKQDVLAGLGVEPNQIPTNEEVMGNHSDDPERLEAFIECLKWLEKRRRDLGWEVKSDEYIEAVAAASEHFEYLQRSWAGGSYEGFRESLRRYASAIAQEMLRIHREGASALKTEEEVLEAFREEREKRGWREGT